MHLRLVLSFVLVITLLSCSSARQKASATLKEASTNLDLKYLEPLLIRMIPLIESGLSAQEAGQLTSTTKAMKVDEERNFSFPIRFRGTSSTLNIRIKKEDVDTIDIYFFAEPELADGIANEIKTFSEQHGL